jgi:hypothetical protein
MKDVEGARQQVNNPSRNDSETEENKGEPKMTARQK